MNNEKTNEGDTQGKEPVDNSTEDTVEPTPAEKVRKDTEELKAENDAYDEQKLRAEVIRAERARGGRSEAGGNIDEEPIDPDQVMAEKLLGDTE